MAVWTFYDYVELTGRNRITEWLAGLSDGDRAKVDYRLLQMAGMSRWPEKWVSKYQGTDELYEFRITGNRVQHRPLGTYYGEKRYLILLGAIERGDKIPRSDIATAEARLARIKNGEAHLVVHRFDDGGPLEENDQEQGV